MKNVLVISIILVLVFGLSGCNLGDSGSTIQPDDIRTIAAMTVQAMNTQKAVLTPKPGTIATTPVPGITITPQNTTPAPGADCNRVTFLMDMNVPDGQIVFPGMTFTKIWRLQNAGTCPWTPDYQLVFANDGDSMGGSLSSPIIKEGTVPPGGKIDVALRLTAPLLTGKYKGFWELKDGKGVTFGLGPKSADPFWLEVEVKSTNFMIDLICAAEWSNDSGRIQCPSKPGNADGYVRRVETPQLETGGIDNEPGLVMGPQLVTNGTITGRFPAFTVPKNTLIKGVISCGYKASNCDTHVVISYHLEGDIEHTLLDVNAKQDGVNDKINLDMNALGLADKKVYFTFKVEAKGDPSDDAILFLNPGFVVKK